MSELDRRQFLRYAGAGAAAVIVSGELELARAIAGPQASSRLGKNALKDLERQVSGRVLVRGGGKAYNQARTVYNKRFSNLRPAAVVEVKNAADVQAVMKWAGKYDVNVRARSGGHSYAGYSTTRGLVVDVTRMNGVELRSGGIARIGAGARSIIAHIDPQPTRVGLVPGEDLHGGIVAM